MLPETDIQSVIIAVLKREGGDENNPHDLGGETHFGITMPFASQWGIPWPPSYTDAAQGYRRMMAGTKLDQIPDAATLDLVTDSAVNHGEDRAIKWLQAAIGVKADGDIGNVTLARFNGMFWGTVYKAIFRTRGMFYAGIIHNEMVNHPDRALKDSQVTFIDGWFDRLFGFL